MRKSMAGRKTNWVYRKLRVRKKIKGTTERPRLNVYRSSRYVYAQVIDDTRQRTIAAASSRLKDPALEGLNKTDAARKVGEIIGKLAIEKGVTKVVFDRSGYLYHGRVKALAEGAREAGLEF